LRPICNTLKPQQPTTAEEFACRDQGRDPKFKFQRWVALEDERVVGVGNYNQSIWFAHPQNFLLWIEVLPERRSHGIGTALFETLMQGLKPFDPLALRAFASQDQPASIRFLEKFGFHEVIRDIESELDVQAFDMARFASHAERFQEKGIRIKTLPQLEDDPERNGKLYDLDWEISMSVPGDLAAGMGRRGLDKYVEYAISGPNVLPDGFFIAVKGEDYIGLSHVLSSEKGVSLYQGLTGVQPAYRGLGLGLALKLRVIAFARANGYLRIRAENDARNLPMLVMNGKLGYVRKPDLITFQKDLIKHPIGSLPKGN
jgi:GNAT superfamily N-acetyltransferase